MQAAKRARCEAHPEGSTGMLGSLPSHSAGDVGMSCQVGEESVLRHEQCGAWIKSACKKIMVAGGAWLDKPPTSSCLMFIGMDLGSVDDHSAHHEV